MSWEKEVRGIEQRRQIAHELGGPEAVAKQHERGRLTVRERVAQLLDTGSFREQGPIAGYSETDEQGQFRSFIPANYVVGFGKIAGRPCVVGGEDFYPQGRLALVRRLSQERVGRRVGVSLPAAPHSLPRRRRWERPPREEQR